MKMNTKTLKGWNIFKNVIFFNRCVKWNWILLKKANWNFSFPKKILPKKSQKVSFSKILERTLKIQTTKWDQFFITKRNLSLISLKCENISIEKRKHFLISQSLIHVHKYDYWHSNSVKHVNKSGRNKYLWLQIEFSCEGINMHVTIMLAVNREIEKTENTITRDLTFAPIPPSGKLSEGFFYLFPHFWNDTPGSWEMFINFSWMNISRLFRKKNKSLRFNVATHVLMI